MKRSIITFLFLILFIYCKQKDIQTYFIEGVSNPIINLNGTWKINTHPPDDFWKLTILNNEWKDIQVPGECMMQGFPIKHDQPFVYKKNIEIPNDFNDKNIILQFDGIYSYARVWINGNFIRDHSGGFTRWECDITPYAIPGKTAILTVEVTDRANEISYASGYAKHQIGGILRSVRLIALPVNYPEEITINTDFDENYDHASLIISGRIKRQSENSIISLELFDMAKEKIILDNVSISLNNNQTFQITNQIKHPNKWDAEHPNLYELRISFSENDKMLWKKVYKVGFREITITGNKLLVNGKEVKLRGACRHDIHPLLGRVSTPEFELNDVILAKEANMNFIRTSHYPPTDNFLQLCDEYGLYVEDETAVCFVGSHRTEEYFPGATENSPDFTEKYLSQLKEMINNHKNHPSIIMWSIGNENSYGTNFKKSYEWVKENDNTRPVIFSYPGKVPDEISSYDILSMHYPGISGNMNQYGKETNVFGYEQMPVIFDEWAHVACYNNFTVMEDPNIRDFWGRSLDMMWQKTFDADGGLGGAIWGMIDETFMLPDSLPGFNKWWAKIDENVIPAEYSGNTIGYGEWGIVDTWRRKKPEFWNTKKAYSPVKLMQTEFKGFTDSSSVSLPVYNRFDHTNIREMVIQVSYNNQTRILDSPDIEPHTKGTLLIPMEEWDPEKKVVIEFFTIHKELVDKYILHLASEDKLENETKPEGIIHIEEDNDRITITNGKKTTMIIDKSTGLIDGVQSTSGNYTFKGPHINLRTKGKSVIYSFHQINEYGKNWQLQDFSYKHMGQYVILKTTGKYNNQIPVEFEISIYPDGKLKVWYQVEKIPTEDIRELGIQFELEDVFNTLSWNRNAYWSYYPDDHLSATKGTTALYPEELKMYRTEPVKTWNFDSKSFYYEGTENEKAKDLLTHIAKSTKENIWQYSLEINRQEVLSVLGMGSISCRISKADNKIHLFANNEMDYIDLSWGNYQRNIKLAKNYSNQVILKIGDLADGER